VSRPEHRLIEFSTTQGLQLPLPPTAATPESILNLRRKLLETRKLNHALRTTHSKNAALISQLQAVLSPPNPAATFNSHDKTPSLAFLTTASAVSASSPTKSLTTNAQFATSQVPALRKLVDELRPKLQALKENGTKNVDWESRREERRKYIEGGVRKVVERDVGVAEGEMDGVERRGREEVEGLERVIVGIGGGEWMEE